MTDETMEMYQYLNRLRESGETNMWGASPYLEDEFGLDRRESKNVLLDWMKWVNENPENLSL